MRSATASGPYCPYQYQAPVHNPVPRVSLWLRSSAALSVLAAALSDPSSAGAQELLGLGYLPGYGNGSFAYDVSADGTAAVGYSQDINLVSSAFRWTTAAGMTQLQGGGSVALGISGDGQAAAGYFYNADHSEAYRWTAAGGLQALGTGGFTSSHALGISADGDTVVGQLHGGGQTQAFAWTELNGLIALGYFQGGTPFSTALDVSDGGIVVGFGRLATSETQAFFKDLAATGDPIQGLGYLTGGDYSFANAITPDAAHIVGASTDATNAVRAVRWTASAPGYGGPVALDGGSSWYYSEAKGVSADGAIVVGSYKIAVGDTDYQAFRWADGGSMQSLDLWLAASGVDTTGWALNEAEGISDDGKTIVGYGQFNSSAYQAFLAREGLLIGTADYSESVASLQEAAHLPAALATGWMLNRMPEASGLQGLSGSLLYDHADGSSANLGGSTLTWRQPGLAVLAGLGMMSAETSLYQGGKALYGGIWLGGGAAVDVGQAFGAAALEGLEISASLRADILEGTINRHYLNGAGVETATGKPGIQSFTGAVRAAWHQELFGGVTLTPYVQWLYNRTQMAGYTETGGAGAGVVSAQANVSNLVSLGADVDWQIAPQLKLGASYSFNHLLDARTAGVSVAVAGLGTFSAPAAGHGSNWHTLGLELEWAPSDRVRFDTSVAVNVGGSYPENWFAGGGVHVGL